LATIVAAGSAGLIVLTGCASTAPSSSGSGSAAGSDSASSSASAPGQASSSTSGQSSAGGSASTAGSASGSSGSSGSGSGTDAGASGTSLASLLPAELRSKGTVTVASDIEYPPFEVYAADNKTVQGIDRDIADEFEKLFGVTFEFVNTPFDAIIPGLVAKRYDMAMSAMSDTPERRKQVDFVDYFKAGGGILVPTANPHHIKTLDDLCGLAVAVDKGTTEVDDAKKQSEKCVADGKKPINSSVYPGQNQMILALQSGRADAAMVDSVSGSYSAKESGKLTMLAPYQAGLFGIVIPKGDTALATAIQKALQQMAKDGSYQKILADNGESEGGLTEFPINQGPAA
jgi:polar amino acid transport system substrate-binding protein